MCGEACATDAEVLTIVRLTHRETYGANVSSFLYASTGIRFVDENTFSGAGVCIVNDPIFVADAAEFSTLVAEAPTIAVYVFVCSKAAAGAATII